MEKGIKAPLQEIKLRTHHPWMQMAAPSFPRAEVFLVEIQESDKGGWRRGWLATPSVGPII